MLRTTLEELGVDTRLCVEKRELVDLYTAFVLGLDSSPTPPQVWAVYVRLDLMRENCSGLQSLAEVWPFWVPLG